MAKTLFLYRDKNEKHEWEGNEKGLLECEEERGGGGLEKEVDFSLISTHTHSLKYSRRFSPHKSASLFSTKNETVKTT